MKFSWRILIFKVSRSGKAGGAESESLGRVKSLNGSIATWLGFSVFLLGSAWCEAFGGKSYRGGDVVKEEELVSRTFHV